MIKSRVDIKALHDATLYIKTVVSNAYAESNGDPYEIAIAFKSCQLTDEEKKALNDVGVVFKKELMEV